MHPLPEFMIDDRGDSIRDLLGRTVDSAKAYAKAEVDVAKQTAAAWSRAAVPGIGFGVAAIMVAQAALTILLAALGLGLATLIGPVGGFLVAAVVGFAIVGILVALAVGRFRRIGS